MPDGIVNVEVDGLERLARMNILDDSAQRGFIDRGMRRLAAQVAAAAPGGAGGSVGRSVYGQAISSDRGVVGSQHPGARALDRGAFITPHHGKVLRFNVGGEIVFARWAHIRARHFFRKGLADAGHVLDGEFQRTFGDR